MFPTVLMYRPFEQVIESRSATPEPAGQPGNDTDVIRHGLTCRVKHLRRISISSRDQISAFLLSSGFRRVGTTAHKPIASSMGPLSPATASPGTVVRCEGHRSGRRGRRRPLPARGPAAARPGSVCGASAPRSEATSHELTAVVNIGDDAWIHGLRVCPDLDTCMYTLGGGVDPQRGWGHRDETWHAKEELARYGVQPDWFELGDRDLATHLVRTQMLQRRLPAVADHHRAVRPLATGRTVAAGQRRPLRDPRGDHRSGRRQPSGDPLPGVVGALPRPGADPQLRFRRR